MSAASAMLTAMEEAPHMSVARVVVDVPTRALSEPFDYAVPEELSSEVSVGVPVLVPLGGQRVVGYVVGLASSSSYAGELRSIETVLGDAVFRSHAPELAQWVSREYVCPLADAMRLFLPPGGPPSAIACYAVAGQRPAGSVRALVWDAVSSAEGLTSVQLRAIDDRFPDAAAGLARAGVLTRTWRMKAASVGAVDDRWAERVPGSDFVPQRRSTMQRALLDALAEGPVRVAELTAELGPVDSALKTLAAAGAVRFESRRRMRGVLPPARSAPRHTTLSTGQSESLAAISGAAPGSVVLLEGVTGSGKTEVYLRAIEDVLAAGGSAIVLVPEISLTPQTVGRFGPGSASGSQSFTAGCRQASATTSGTVSAQTRPRSSSAPARRCSLPYATCDSL